MHFAHDSLTQAREFDVREAAVARAADLICSPSRALLILVTRRHRAPGSRVTHPYSRVTAIPIIFDEVRRKLRECREHYEYKRRCVYCDMIRQEIAGGDRVVRLTDHFLALSPYAARSPFETWILPRQHNCLYEGSLSGEVVADLAGIMGGLFRTLAAKMGDPAFEMTLYTAPNLTAKILPRRVGDHRRRLPLAHRGLHHPRPVQRGGGDPRQ